MDYRIDDINIGDEVIFYSTRYQSNFDHFWTVIGKSDNELFIELKKFGINQNWTLNIRDVRGVHPLGK